MRAVVADREVSVRRAITLLLTHELSFQMVREAATPSGLRRQVQRVRPDILIVDWGLVTAGPVGLISILRGLCPGLRVLALHVHEDVREVALAAGADSFVGKGEGPGQVVRALQTLCSTTVISQGDVS